MRRGVSIRAAVLLAFVMAAPAAAQHVHGGASHSHPSDTDAAGVPGDPQRPARTIEVTMREQDGKMLFSPDRIEVKRGEQVRFVLVNSGELDHEFVIGTAAEIAAHAKEMADMPDMAHDEPNGRAVKTRARGELLWRFTRAGSFSFACLIPGHLDAGMKGAVIVK